MIAFVVLQCAPAPLVASPAAMSGSSLDSVLQKSLYVREGMLWVLYSTLFNSIKHPIIYCGALKGYLRGMRYAYCAGSLAVDEDTRKGRPDFIGFVRQRDHSSSSSPGSGSQS